MAIIFKNPNELKKCIEEIKLLFLNYLDVFIQNKIPYFVKYAKFKFIYKEEAYIIDSYTFGLYEMLESKLKGFGGASDCFFSVLSRKTNEYW